MTSCAIYARKSSTEEVADDAKSITRQVDHARQYAARKGWTVSEEHVFLDDAVSGAEFTKRPGLMRLMNALKRPPFTVLIVSEISRIGREQLETGYIVKQLSQAGVRLYAYLEDKEVLCESAIDKVMMSLASFAADMEREKARQRASDTALRKARAGHVTGGSCFGYRNLEVTGPDGRRSHVRREVVPEEADVLRRLFALAAEGHGFKGIAKRLNEDGAQAPRAQLGRSRTWAPSSVREALFRSAYRGEVVWNQSRKRDSWGQHRQVARPESEWVRTPAPELRIVSDELWQVAHTRIDAARAVYVRGRSSGRPPLGSVSPYLLTNLANCGVCGGVLWVRSVKGSAATADERRYFYGCGSYHSRGRTVCANGRDVPMAEADRTLLEVLLQDVLTPDVVRDAVDTALEVVMVDTSAPSQGRLSHDLARIEQERDRLVSAVAAGGQLPALLAALQQREAERLRLMAEIAARPAQARQRPSDAARVRRELLALARNWRHVLAGDPEHARPILTRVLDGRVTFTPGAEPKRWTLSGRATLSGLFATEVFLSNWRPHTEPHPTGIEFIREFSL